mmetsp:Transcript_1183/g.5259  ORF Transcript_1183/g.5259 Transcript_1183/m.5259 type:complete len:417 (-) Transcript_1183:419-1669(-)
MVVTPEPYPLPLHVRDVVTALHRPAVHHDRVQIVLCPVLRGRVRRLPVPEPTHPVPVPGPERRRRAVGPHVQDERERHVNVNLTTDGDGVPVPKTALLRPSLHRPGLAHEVGLEPFYLQHERGGKTARRHLFRLDPRRIPAPSAGERLVAVDVLGPGELAEARLEGHRLLRAGRVSVCGAGHVQRQAHRRVVHRGRVSARPTRHIRPEHPRERRVHRAFTVLHQHRPARPTRAGAHRPLRSDRRRPSQRREGAPRSFARRQVRVHRGDQGEEELVRVVLLMLGEVLRRLHPPAVQKVARHQRVGAPGVSPRHDRVQLARQAVLVLGRGEHTGVDGLGDRDVALRRAQLPIVTVLEEEPSHRRGPHHGVQHGGEEARVAEVGEAAANLADGRPRHADALARVERVRDDDAARGTLRG